MDLIKKKCAVKFLSLSCPFFFLFFSFSFFFFFLLLPRNDTMPVNPYKTFPVWQQAVSPSFTFVLKTAGLGKTRLASTLQCAPVAKSSWQQRPKFRGN